MMNDERRKGFRVWGNDLSGKTAAGHSRPCGGRGGERIQDATRQGVLDNVDTV